MCSYCDAVYWKKELSKNVYSLLSQRKDVIEVWGFQNISPKRKKNKVGNMYYSLFLCDMYVSISFLLLIILTMLFHIFQFKV